jgi:ABC-2 type transport system ATP-binding protein
LFEAFGMGEELHVPVAQYSLGMRRKLLLVEALTHGPSLLLLDEPTLGLDPSSLETLGTILREAAARESATLLSTNDVHAAQDLASRVVFLRDGRKVADAPPGELLEAVRDVTLIEVRFEGALESLPALSGGSLVTRSPDGISVRTREGSAALPALCGVLVERGVQIRGVAVREADLSDVFREVTGADLAPGGSAPVGEAGE